MITPPNVPKCGFSSDALEIEATEICADWFEGGELVAECGALGIPTFAFFGEACVCDIALADDIEKYRVSLCALTVMCIDIGVSGVQTLFDSHCFGFESTTATSTATTTPGSTTEGEKEKDAKCVSLSLLVACERGLLLCVLVGDGRWMLMLMFVWCSLLCCLYPTLCSLLATSALPCNYSCPCCNPVMIMSWMMYGALVWLMWLLQFLCGVLLVVRCAATHTSLLKEGNVCGFVDFTHTKTQFASLAHHRLRLVVQGHTTWITNRS